MKTKILRIDPQDVRSELILEVARAVREGQLVVFPTETVYGIAANYADPQAMARLIEVKRRSAHKPFSSMIAQKELIRNYTPITDPRLYKLIDRYWPGPLTVIVPTDQTGKTLGVRIPDHPVALKILEHAHCTIAAPSANFEGSAPPLTCEQALQELDGLVDLAVDSGPVELGQASSIVDFTQERPTVVREGVISQADVDEVTSGKNVLFVCTGNSCRSVMAEYMFRDMLKERTDVSVASAGTGVFFSTSASQEAVSVLAELGLDASGHLSQPVTNILVKKADLIFVMTRSHRMQVLEHVPAVEKRLYLLGEFQSGPIYHDHDLDIPDPIGRPHALYQECRDAIKDCLQRVVRLV